MLQKNLLRLPLENYFAFTSRNSPKHQDQNSTCTANTSQNNFSTWNWYYELLWLGLSQSTKL